ncbi:hypothetical protein V6N13_042487 [Hibiscus sabdariffa]|uniref:Uncharacterized protein n=1 Tax=Hibiscus sabdariffa TaxID=183260 RepID=A0ABR2G4L2_9ROSI
MAEDTFVMTLNGNLGISEEEERELGIEDSGNWESNPPIKQTLECDTVLVSTIHEVQHIKSKRASSPIMQTA